MVTLQDVLVSVRNMRREIEQVEEFLEDLSAKFTIRHDASRSHVGLRAWSDKEPITSRVVPEAPTNWKDRVAMIVREHGPLQPKDVTAHYQRLQWPGHDREGLSNQIRSTLYFMKKDGTVQEQDGNYSIVEPKP